MGALRTYLLHKLDHISEKDTTQRILVSTWLVQLYLDSLNTETSKERFSQTMEELKQILKENCKTLDPKTTLDLLATHGRTDPLLFFAKITGENELLINNLSRFRDLPLLLQPVTLLRDITLELSITNTRWMYY